MTDHVRWLAEPRLRKPTMIAAFTGWNDAGDAASESARQLVRSWQATPLAEIDPEEFTDFATVRPHVRLDGRRKRSIVWPTVGLWSASTPGGDVILVLGPEPALRWRLFIAQLVGVAERFQVPMLITLGALLADVPHTRPVRVIGTASDDAVLERYDLQPSNYQGPTGIIGVLHDALATEGIPSASLWAAVPAYASQVPGTAATAALVERVSGLVGSPSPAGDLQIAADHYREQVDAVVQGDVELSTYVDRLESMYDSGDDEFDTESYDSDSDDDDDGDGDDGTADHDIAGPADEGVAGGRPAELPGQTVLGLDGFDEADMVREVEQFLREQGLG